VLVARFLDCVDPGLCCLLGGAADIRGLLLREGVERYVADATCFGDHMPLYSLHRVGFQPAPDRQNIGEAVLSDRIAFARSLLHERGRQRLIPRDTRAVEQSTPRPSL